MKELLEKCVTEGKKVTSFGEVAHYIPELKNSNKDAVGIYLIDKDRNHYYAGDHNYKFTIQSVSKAINFLLCLENNELDMVLKKLSISPTSEMFNSIVQLETKNENKPLNPLINAGAILTISLIGGDDYNEKFNYILDYFKKVTGNGNLSVDEGVYKSEKETGNRNRSIAYYMKSTGILDGDVEEILDIYFKICSFSVTVKDIAMIGYVLASGGYSSDTDERLASEESTRIVRSVMATCGLYDESGDFAVFVGTPSKSGVGGGILSAVPNRMGIGTVGPSLNQKGNSIAGMKMMEILSKELNLSIY
ncbi:glutaminase A [Mycoplasmatota bacterium WC44]